MMWLKDFGPMIEDIYGSARFLFLYMVTGIIGFVWSTAWDVLITHQASGIGIGASLALYAWRAPKVGLGARFELVSPRDYLNISLQTTRGCPFKCEFCLSALDRTAWPFDTARFLDALRTLYDRGARHFRFVDRTFNLKIAASLAILGFFLERLSDELFIHFELIPDHLPEKLKSAILRFPAGTLHFEVGIQTWDEAVQARIARRQDNAAAEANLRWLREASPALIHVDLIAGLPEQKPETWRRNLDEAFALAPDHLSVYLLELYKDAPLLHRVERGELRAIDDELTVEMYFALKDEAARRGFDHYEISNWARPGFESRHNLKYWTGAPYWAFGVSAAGYDGRTRWSNTRNIHEYLERVESGQSPVAERIELDDEDRQSEALFLQLRLREGVDLAEHRRRFGVDALARYGEEIARLREAGLIELTEERMKISRAGTVLANEVFAAFV